MKWYFFSTVFCISFLGIAQTSIVGEEINRISKESAKNGTIGISMVELNSGKEVIAFNSEKWFVPASSLKILTTSVALGILGKDFKFKTEIYYDGTIENSVLKGNLILKGYGDPTFCSHRYENETRIWQTVANTIKTAGILAIDGKIIADNSEFLEDDFSGKWILMDLGNYYGADAQAINYRENFIKVVFKRTQTVGDCTKILQTIPEIKNLMYKNYVTTGTENSGDQAYIYGTTSGKQYIKGTIPAGKDNFTIKAAMPNPEIIAINALESVLKTNGIFCKNISIQNNDRKLIHTHLSENLQDIISKTNLYSINLYAEAMLKTIAWKKTGNGSREKGIELVKNYLKEQGIETKELMMEDGSGLSPLNLAKPITFSKTLVKNSSTLKSTLAKSGETGTLKNFGKGTILESKFYGKSGNMERVMSYSGYLTCKSGKEYAISIFANNYSVDDYKMKKELEKLFVVIYEGN